MCTVTYIPKNKTNFIFTSSRDVPYKRAKALAPQEYIEHGIKITYPKDPQGQGSWIGLSQYNRIVCLLNGGFENHQPKGSYAKSRGLIVKALLLVNNNVIDYIKNIDLENIEPFTIILIDWNNFETELIELVWTGTTRFITTLDKNNEYIWSSSTLYTKPMKTERKKWFANWNKDNAKQILDFHHRAGVENPETAVLMKRENVGTVSISQLEKKDNAVSFYYEAIDAN